MSVTFWEYLTYFALAGGFLAGLLRKLFPR